MWLRHPFGLAQGGLRNEQGRLRNERGDTLCHLRNLGLLRNPIHVTLNEVKGLLTLVESSSRRFFAAFRMTKGGFFNSPNLWMSSLDLGGLGGLLSQDRRD